MLKGVSMRVSNSLPKLSAKIIGSSLNVFVVTVSVHSTILPDILLIISHIF